MPYDVQKGPDYYVVRKKVGRRWRVLHVYEGRPGGMEKARERANAYLRALYAHSKD